MSFFATKLRSNVSMLAALAMMIAVGASSVMLAGNATAAPLTVSKGAITQAHGSDVTLVRDGCGRGMRFSNRRQACVEMDGINPGAAIVNGIIGGALGDGPRRGRGGEGCRPGFRFSHSRGQCVPF